MHGKITVYHQIKTYLCNINSRNPIKRDRDMRYSVIIPVYNRPDEADELLQSLTRQSFKDFEVIIVEDGSSVPCKDVAVIRTFWTSITTPSPTPVPDKRAITAPNAAGENT